MIGGNVQIMVYWVDTIEEAEIELRKAVPNPEEWGYVGKKIIKFK